jgi:nucleotide-binding universal stress UspA family protein
MTTAAVQRVQRKPGQLRPGSGLIRAASGAALLVLGDRGRGRAARALLGSVAGELVSSAICPIAVVPSGAGQD